MADKKENIDLDNPEFQTLWQLISYTRQSVFLTGKAGTGKSTFLRYICSHTKKKHVVLAPTGIAAVNAGGVTIHSFFKLPFKPFLPDDPDFASPRRLRDRMKYKRSFITLLREIELIVIDEISMVRADIIDFIDVILRTFCHNSREPFAGKQLLLVGDIFQLEPVVTSDMKELLKRFYRYNFFFNARAFAASEIVAVELRKVYRQDDENFISLLDRIRTGHPLPSDILTLNSRFSPDIHDHANGKEFTMTLATRRDIVDYINERHLARLRTPQHTYSGKIDGEFPENSIPTPMQLTLRADAQVVFIKNDMERRWVNGTIGKITECFDDCVEVELENGTRHLVEPDIWKNIRYSYNEEAKRVEEVELGSYTQLPLRLAWALTIHKSQGLTFSKAVIDLGSGAFTSGQTYVALSRCRSLEGLSLSSTINERDMLVNPVVIEFSKNYNNPATVKRALDAARADDCYAKACEAAKMGKYASAFDYFTEGLRARSELHNKTAMRLARIIASGIENKDSEADKLREEVEQLKGKLRKLATEYVDMGEDCREEAGDLDAAIANYNKAIDLAPDYAPAWLAKGIALNQAQNPDAAIDCLYKAASIDSSDFHPHLELGRIFHALGDFHNGLDRLLVAEKINPKSPLIHYALADLYEAIEDIENAEAHRKKADRLSRRRKKK